MPALAFHYFFGYDILPFLKEDLSNTIESNKKAFELGLQGPDIFYYYRPLFKNKVNRIAHSLHEADVINFFIVALNKLKKKFDPVIFSYCAGFICHYTLDFEYHPYINGVSKGLLDHFALENSLDWYAISKRHDDPSFFKRYSLIHTDKIITEALSELFEEVSKGRIKKAIKTMRKCNRIIYILKSILRWFPRYSSRLISKRKLLSCVLLKHNPSPPYEQHVEHLNGLYLNACEKAHKCIHLFQTAYSDEDCSLNAFEKALHKPCFE